MSGKPDAVATKEKNLEATTATNGNGSSNFGKQVDKSRGPKAESTRRQTKADAHLEAAK